MKKNKAKEKSDFYGHKFVIGLGAGTVLMLVGIFYFGIHAKPADQSSPTAGPVPIYFKSEKDAMPFPMTVDPSKFKRTDVQEAYQVAKQIPGVLAQQPCYCYCQRQGHRGLLDCFRTEHAATCTICIKEALLAGQMHHQDKSAQEIRAAIIHGDWANVVARTEPTGSEVK